MNDDALHEPLINRSSDSKKSPWREPWFWFVLGPLLLTIATSSVFVYIAVSGADQRVVDDYYSAGKAINHRFEADKLAIALGVGAVVRVDKITQEVFVELSGLPNYPGELILYFSHPVKSSEDTTLPLKQINTNRYRADLSKIINGRWYLQLSPQEAITEKKWRLVGELDLNKHETITLTPEIQ
jgi:hypothetical protein